MKINKIVHFKILKTHLDIALEPPMLYLILFYKQYLYCFL